MFCPKCGKGLNGNEKFCSKCGYSIPLINNENNVDNNNNGNSSNKKNILLIVLVILFVLAIGLLILHFVNKKNNDKYSSASNETQITYSYAENGIPKFIDGSFSSKIINNSEDVLKSLENIKKQMHFNDISKELKLSLEETSEGMTYYRYDQVYNDIKVYNQNIIVSVDKNKKISSFSGYFIPNINVDTNPQKNKDEVQKIVSDDLGTNSNIINCELNILADDEEQLLIYVISGYSDSKSLEYIVNANTGEIIDKISPLYEAENYSYTGEGIDNKAFTINLEKIHDNSNNTDIYKFYDDSRKISVTDCRECDIVSTTIFDLVFEHKSINANIVNNKIEIAKANTDFAKAAISSMGNFAKIYDYYKNVLNRNSYDNKGSKIVVNLGFIDGKDGSFENAAWSNLTNKMYIGRWKSKYLSASLDVLAHEFTHGVISYTSHFASTAKKSDKNKAFETGALNEGYSDIMGNLIEGKNWTIAESNETLRSASEPEKYNYPSVKGGEYYYPDGYLNGRTIEQYLKDRKIESITDLDKGGVHDNSNVVSHAAYLMYDAGAFDSREQMAKVWYNSLFLLSSYSNFEDCALAVIKTAQNMGLSGDSIYKITKAFVDTKMLESKNLSLSGKITSGNEIIKDAKIEVYSNEKNTYLDSTVSDSNGKYELELSVGVYKIKVIKDGFEKYETLIVLKGKTTLDIELAAVKNSFEKTDYCDSSDCVTLTIYYLEPGTAGVLREGKTVYTINKGTKADINELLKIINNQSDGAKMSSDGETFSVSVGEFNIDASWYYRGTDNKVNFNLPINDNIEIEMKIDGSLDNNSILELIDSFKKNK